jgi:hypothetical protein
MFLFQRSNSLIPAIDDVELNGTSHSQLSATTSSNDQSVRRNTQQLHMAAVLSNHHHAPLASASQPLNQSPPARTSQQAKSSKPLDFGHYEEAVEGLRYTVYDLVALTSNDKCFHQLKASLRKNGAVTNELLKQGLPLFLHKNRSVILSRYFKELDNQQDEAEKNLAGSSDTAFLRGTISRPKV